MKKLLHIIFFLLLSNNILGLVAKQETALSVSERLSKILNPRVDSTALENFYGYFSIWMNSLNKRTIPDNVLEALNKGNFCVRKIVRINYTLRILVIEAGPTRDFDVSELLGRITKDSILQNVFEPIDRPRDAFYLLALANHNGRPLLSSMFVQQSYSELEIKPIPSRPDTGKLFSYEINESSLGGGYSLVRLVIVSADDNSLNVIFDSPIVESNHSAGENKEYHYLYDVTNKKLVMLRIDEEANTETIENYFFNGRTYVKTK